MPVDEPLVFDHVIHGSQPSSLLKENKLSYLPLISGFNINYATTLIPITNEFIQSRPRPLCFRPPVAIRKLLRTPTRLPTYPPTDTLVFVVVVVVVVVVGGGRGGGGGYVAVGARGTLAAHHAPFHRLRRRRLHQRYYYCCYRRERRRRQRRWQRQQ